MLAEGGVRDLTIDGVATRAGVAKTTIWGLAERVVTAALEGFGPTPPPSAEAPR
jgi:hypothetical protein